MNLKKLPGTIVFLFNLLVPMINGLGAAEIPAQRGPLNTSVYIDMPDGVKIAAEVWLPPQIDQQKTVPAIVAFTRYWRVTGNGGPGELQAALNRQGFAVVNVDVRGTGASFGYRQAEMSVSEVRDFPHVLNWVASQPWSNGALATIGSSYVGNTSELAMLDAPAALKAAVPRFTDFDVYAHLIFPGGLPNTGFLDPWSDGVRALDLDATTDDTPLWHAQKSRIKPVAGDTDKTLLRQAVNEHHKNVIVARQFRQIMFRDDEAMGLQKQSGFTVVPYQVQDNIRLNQIPTYHWASFADAGTAAGAIARFMRSDAPMRVVIGYWNHGAYKDSNPFRPKESELKPSEAEQFNHIGDFLKTLKNPQAVGPAVDRVLYYFTAGENAWKKTTVWPPQGVEMQRYYLRENAALATGMPKEETGRDHYRVNFAAGTGPTSRWYQMDDVYYGNRAKADKLLLTYTSEPLQEDMEITGHPVVYLRMSSSEPDGAVIVYLEDVAPDGAVTMLTEGNLRLLHRKISQEEPPYPVFGPYHTFKRKDALPMRPGEVARVEFAMLPLSVRIKKGHALRLAIAGHDKDTFNRIPEQGTPVYQIYRRAGALSYVDIPMRNADRPAARNRSVDPFER